MDAQEPRKRAHRGGHFAALEAPDLLGADLRDFFRALD
jgi:hypothetical protein